MTLESLGPAAAGFEACSWNAKARPERARATSVVGRDFMGDVVERKERSTRQPTGSGDPLRPTQPIRNARGCRGFRQGARLYSEGCPVSLEAESDESGCSAGAPSRTASHSLFSTMASDLVTRGVARPTRDQLLADFGDEYLSIQSLFQFCFVPGGRLSLQKELTPVEEWGMNN